MCWLSKYPGSLNWSPWGLSRSVQWLLYHLKYLFVSYTRCRSLYMFQSVLYSHDNLHLRNGRPLAAASNTPPSAPSGFALMLQLHHTFHQIWNSLSSASMSSQFTCPLRYLKGSVLPCLLYIVANNINLQNHWIFRIKHLVNLWAPAHIICNLPKQTISLSTFLEDMFFVSTSNDREKGKSSHVVNLRSVSRKWTRPINVNAQLHYFRPAPQPWDFSENLILETGPTAIIRWKEAMSLCNKKQTP